MARQRWWWLAAEVVVVLGFAGVGLSINGSDTKCHDPRTGCDSYRGLPTLGDGSAVLTQQGVMTSETNTTLK